MELGIMLALGKPTIILAKIGQEQQLKLPSDVIGIEVIPFDEYLDIIDPLRECLKKLPTTVTVSTPIENLEKIDPQIAEKLEKLRDEIVKEFKKNIEKAKLDISLSREEKKELSPELNERLRGLEEKLEVLRGLGLIADAETSLSRGDFFYQQGKFKEAIASYDWSLELKPDNHVTLHNRGTTYIKLEKYDEAMADFKRALEIKPGSVDALYNRGYTYLKKKKYDEAMADYKQLLSLKPEDASALYNLACVFSLQNKIDDALVNLEKAISINKKYREDAKTDTDFDNIRNDSRFKELIGE
jgi:tetratricopeptide (TPR) repeat protein